MRRELENAKKRLVHLRDRFRVDEVRDVLRRVQEILSRLGGGGDLPSSLPPLRNDPIYPNTNSNSSTLPTGTICLWYPNVQELARKKESNTIIPNPYGLGKSTTSTKHERERGFNLYEFREDKEREESPPEGWAICDGRDGPDLSKLVTSFLGGIGTLGNEREKSLLASEPSELYDGGISTSGFSELSAVKSMRTFADECGPHKTKQNKMA